MLRALDDHDTVNTEDGARRTTNRHVNSWRRSQAGREGVGYAIVSLCFLSILFFALVDAKTAAVVFALAAIFGLGVADLRGLLALTAPAWALTGAIFSVHFIENGAYITEQGRRGVEIGATPTLCLYAIAFLAIAHFALTRAAGNRTYSIGKLKEKRLRSAIFRLTIALMAFYIIVFILYGTGFGYSSRFSWAASLPGMVARIHWLLRSYLIPPIYALLGVHVTVFGIRSKDRLWFPLMLPILALVATGERYSALVAACSMLLTGIGIGGYLRGRIIRIDLRSILVVGAIGFGIFGNLVARYMQDESIDLYSGILGRFALQGHVWFGVYSRFDGNAGVSVYHLIRPNTYRAPAGLDLLSYYVADYSFVNDRIARGLTFTMGGPPSALAAYGEWSGLAVFGLLGLLYAAAVLLFGWYLRNRPPLESLVALSLYALVGAATLMGNWSALYGPVAIACYFALWASALTVRRGSQNHFASGYQRFAPPASFANSRSGDGQRRFERDIQPVDASAV